MARCRHLTAGEKSLASSVFGDAVDLDIVEMRLRKWWPLQPRDVIMAPCGHLHFHPAGDLWRADFSSASVTMRGLFIHELCHVWQSQRGLFLPLRRPPFARYSYALRPGKAFTSYGIEQQAEIVANTYLMREGYRLASPEQRQQHEKLISELR